MYEKCEQVQSCDLLLMISNSRVHVLNFEGLEMRHFDKDSSLIGESNHVLNYSIRFFTSQKPQLCTELYVLKLLKEIGNTY